MRQSVISNVNKSTDNKEEKTMVNSIVLQAKFDAMIDEFNPDDEISIENTNYEMHKNWKKFLKAGFDAEKVIAMMSPKDIWDNYEEIVKYTDIDMEKIFANFKEYFDEAFVVFHWNELVTRGLAIYLPMRQIIDNCIAFEEFIQEFLEKGGKLEELTKKFITEIGYSSDPEESNAMLDLVLSGAPIDHKKFVDSIDLDQLDTDAIENIYECLIDAGYEESLINKFVVS